MRIPAPIWMAGTVVALAAVPFLKLPAFYESFLYLVYFWIVLATSWNILSGYSGYFSFGHGAFVGAGVYTTAVLTTVFDVPFLATLPAAAALAALLGVGIGAIVFRVGRLRGELFALLTLAVTFVLATIVLNTPIDGGPGVLMSGVPLPTILSSPSSTFYVLALILLIATLAIARGIYRAKLGLGLFAIHDDEDAAEVLGVPTYRYKLSAFGISCALAGVAGGIQAMFISYVTVGETFSIVVPLNVVLMSVLGGTRHWLGPAVGATVITALLYAFTTSDYPIVGRAAVGLILIVVILFMPDGMLGRFVPRLRRSERAPAASVAEPSAQIQKTQQARRKAKRCSRRRPVESIQGIAGARRGDPAGQTRRNSRPDRPQRIGQIHADQRGERPLSRRRRPYSVSRRGSCANRSAPDRPPRDRAHLSDPATFRAFERAAKRGAARALRACRARPRRRRPRGMVLAGVHRARRQGRCDAGRAQPAPAQVPRTRARPRPRSDLLLLDEVLSGLTPSEIDDAIRTIRTIRDLGATIVFVEHVMRAVMELTDRIVVLNHGRVIAEGLPDDVMRRSEVVTAYLGKPHA